MRQSELIATASVIFFVTGSAIGQCGRWLSGGVENIAPNTDDSIYAMTVWDPDGPGPKPEMLVVAGKLSVLGSPGVSTIAAWDGIAWHGFGNGSFAPIRALTVYNGELIAGGDYSTNQPSHLAVLRRWDGTVWQSVGGGVSGGLTETRVLALTVFDEKLIVGGQFSDAGGTRTSNNVTQWNGSNWLPMGSGVAGGFRQDDSVRALAVHQNRLIVGGSFSLVGTHDWPFVASWNGSAWEQLPGLNGDLPGCSALLSDGDDLYAGGTNFLLYGTMTCPGLARWNGLSWNRVGNPNTYPTGITALARYGTQLIAGGDILLAKLTVWDGSIWTPFELGPSGIVRAMTSFHGELVVGGDFLYAGGMPAPHLARWTGSGVPWVASQPVARSAPRGGRAIFTSSVAPGYQTGAVQWKKNGELLDDSESISGVSTPTLLVRPVGDTHAGNYSCLFTNDCGEVESIPVPLLVKCAGDINDDGFVDDADFSPFAVSYDLLDCANSAMAVDCLADLSGDGFVDDADFVIFVAAYEVLLCP